MGGTRGEMKFSREPAIHIWLDEEGDLFSEDPRGAPTNESGASGKLKLATWEKCFP